jgi:hypothetical protein
VKEELKLLVELQALDTTLSGLDRRLGEIPRRLESLRTSYQKEVRIQDELKSARDASVKARRSAEMDLEAHEDRIRKMKEQQFMVKTNREYQEFNLQIETMNRKGGDLEEKILVLLEKTAEIEKEIRGHQAVVEAERKALEGEEAKLMAEKGDLDGRHREAAAQRSALASRISPAALGHYDRLREHYHGQAVVAVIQGICQGCFISLRPQRFQEVRLNEEILTCEQCRRILYHDDAQTPPPAET